MSSTVEQARDFFLEGVRHFEAGRLEEARSQFEASLALAPGRSSILTNLGVVQVRLGCFGEALPLLDQALAQEPDNLEALAHRAMALAEAGRPEQALADTQRVLAHAPDYGKAWGLRGNLLKELGQPGQAIVALERAIELGSEVELNRYVLAGLRGDLPPTAPPAAYVEALFDSYADQFDQHLVETLQYRAPQRLLEPLCRQGRRFERALDLGCGTGLCGPWLRKLARHVAGVDLSARMLERAEQGRQYDELAQADIVAWLAATPQPWDLVVAADVFIYVGALEPAFEALARVMPSGGVLCFSLEESARADLELRASLRYAHSLALVQRVAQAQGFELQSCERAAIRQDQGQAIPGLYLWLQRR